MGTEPTLQRLRYWERFTNHLASFRNSKYKESTNLSQRIWELKNNNKNFDIKWSIVASASSYNPCSKKCNLCVMEMTLILTLEDPHPLNKRKELMNKCIRHRRKFLLSSLWLIYCISCVNDKYVNLWLTVIFSMIL